MALTLGVKVGDVVDVAEHWVAVLSVDSRNSATLISNDGQKIAVSSNQMTEMVPVWIGLGPDATAVELCNCGRFDRVLISSRNQSVKARNNGQTHGTTAGPPQGALASQSATRRD